MDDEGCVCLLYVWVVGVAVAAVLSWSANHSVGWLILQGAGSWIYIGYYVWQNGWS